MRPRRPHQPTVDELLVLVDRSERGTLTAAEAHRLRQGLGILARLQAERSRLCRELARLTGRWAPVRSPEPARARPERIRQLAALRLTGRGLSNAQIGKELWVSGETIKKDLTEIYREFGATDRTNAYAIAVRLGFIDPAEVPLPEKVRGWLATQDAA